MLKHLGKAITASGIALGVSAAMLGGSSSAIECKPTTATVCDLTGAATCAAAVVSDCSGHACGVAVASTCDSCEYAVASTCSAPPPPTATPTALLNTVKELIHK